MTAPTDEIVLREDRVAWPMLLRLTDCLCAELVASGLPPTCICSPMPGEAIAAVEGGHALGKIVLDLGVHPGLRRTAR